MTSSEEPEDELDEAFAAFKRQHGVEEWTVRFTADEFRAREMADQYRDAGFDVRVLPLTPMGEELDVTTFGEFDDFDHDPLQYVETESCAGCLDGSHVVLTKPDETGAVEGPADALYDGGGD